MSRKDLPWRGAMVESLDVFAVGGGNPEWLGSAETLQQAIEVVVKQGEGSYFVFNQNTGHRDFYNVTASGAVARAVKTGATATGFSPSYIPD